MKNHLLENLHPNLTGGTPLNIFKILKNLTEKSYGTFKIWRQKIQKNSNLLVAHRLLGAPLVTEQNIGFKKKLDFFFQKMIRNMTGKFEIFFKISSYS